MSELSLARQRLLKAYQSLSITTVQYCRYIGIEEQLAKGGSTTYMLSKALKVTCKELRRDLRDMEKCEAVIAESNGSNSVYWSVVK